MKKENKVIKIRVEYEDGTIKEAEGQDADAIMKWWNSCELMAFVHGSEFKGNPLKEVKK